MSFWHLLMELYIFCWVSKIGFFRIFVVFFVESFRVFSRFDQFGQLVLLGDAFVVYCLILMLIIECFCDENRYIIWICFYFCVLFFVLSEYFCVIKSCIYMFEFEFKHMHTCDWSIMSFFRKHNRIKSNHYYGICENDRHYSFCIHNPHLLDTHKVVYTSF
jgi:hypothetical protein